MLRLCFSSFREMRSATCAIKGTELTLSSNSEGDGGRCGRRTGEEHESREVSPYGKIKSGFVKVGDGAGLVSSIADAIAEAKTGNILSKLYYLLAHRITPCRRLTYLESGIRWMHNKTRKFGILNMLSSANVSTTVLTCHKYINLGRGEG